MPRETRFKIVMIGDSGVGKTAIVSRMSHNTFLLNHVPTVGSQFVAVDFNYEGRNCVFEIWDTAGQEVYRSLVGFYTREARGAFLVVDVTSESSFESLATWVRFIRKESPTVKIVLFGNKTDLAGQRAIPIENLEEFAREANCDFLEGSAKTGMRVREAFEKMAEMLAPEERAEQERLFDGQNQEKGPCC
jgi:small GTP-binding protein